MALCMVVGTFVSFLVGVLDPRVANKAGPDWLWRGGRTDPIRGLYFKPNGSFRRFGLPALIGTLTAGSFALYALLA